jgi:hypothetical protein|tara:strand:+ start:754 stop:1095 length:342 start_codon:yes stop_codon:yes gene_type:complete
MNDEVNERWFDQIRGLATVLEKAVRDSHEAKAQLKKIIAQTKLKALAEGHKTAVSQEIYADNTIEVFEARLNVGVAESLVDSTKVNIDAYKIGFQEWQTRTVNAREERKRYNA